jgi:hypothetical protein
MFFVFFIQKNKDMKYFTFLPVVLAMLLSPHAQAQSSANNLSSFAGKYQFTGNKMTFLQISRKDSGLLLKQLWDNQEIYFKRTGDLTFYNDDHSFPLAFTKDNQGKVTQVLAFDRDLWNKVADNYQPQLQKIVKLSPEQLKAFEGKYQLNGGDADDFLTMSAVGDHLVLTQLWDQHKIELWPVAPLEFFNDKQTFPVNFIAEANGAVNQILVNGRDKWVKVK